MLCVYPNFCQVILVKAQIGPVSNIIILRMRSHQRQIDYTPDRWIHCCLCESNYH